MARSAILSIRIVSDAKDAQKGIRDTETSLQRFERFSRRAGLAAIAVGGAFIAAGKQFADMSNTIRLGTGATGPALDSLMDSAKAVGRQVPNSLQDVATAIADLNTATGATGPELEALSKQFLDLSRITGTDVSQSISSLTRAFGDWGIQIADMPATMDMLWRASQETGSSVDQLAQRIVQFGAPMRSMGFSIEETTALLGTFEKTGVNTELVMGSMRQALMRFARDGQSAPETLRELITEIRDMEDPTQAAARAMEVFGARAGADMADTIRGGKFEIQSLVDTIAGSGDTISQAAADTETFTEKWDRLKNNVLIAIAPIAERVIDVFTSGMAALLPLVENNEAAITAIAVAVGVLAAGVLAVNAAFSVYRAIVIAATAAQWLLNTALLANPIGIIIIALVAVAAAFVVAYQRSETFRNVVQAVASAIGSAMSAAANVIRAVFSAAVSFLSSQFNRVRAVASGVWSAMQTGAAIAAGAIRGIVNAISAVISWLNRLRNLASSVGSAIRSVIPFFSAGMPDVITVGAENFTRLIPDTSVMAEAAGPEVMAQNGSPFPSQAATPSMTINNHTINITIEGALDPVAVGRQVQDVMRRYGRTTGATHALRMA